MGYYFERKDGGSLGKLKELLEHPGAKCIPRREALQAFDEDKGIFVGLENGVFDAVAFCYSRKELEYMLKIEPSDLRRFTYVEVPSYSEGATLVGMKV